MIKLRLIFGDDKTIKKNAQEKKVVLSAGFTLIELLVIVAITGILSITVTGLMVTFAQVKYASDVQTQLQSEANFAAARIESLIINSNQIPDLCWQNGVIETENTNGQLLQETSCSAENKVCCDGTYANCRDNNGEVFDYTYGESDVIVLAHNKDIFQQGKEDDGPEKYGEYLKDNKVIDHLYNAELDENNEWGLQPSILSTGYLQAIYLQPYQNDDLNTLMAQAMYDEENNAWLIYEEQGNGVGDWVTADINQFPGKILVQEVKESEVGGDFLNEYMIDKQYFPTKEQEADAGKLRVVADDILYLTSDDVAVSNLNFYCRVENPTSPINRAGYVIYTFTVSKRKEDLTFRYEDATDSRSFETYTVSKFIELRNTNS